MLVFPPLDLDLGEIIFRRDVRFGGRFSALLGEGQNYA
jgi:hypothetical protein